MSPGYVQQLLCQWLVPWAGTLLRRDTLLILLHMLPQSAAHHLTLFTEMTSVYTVTSDHFLSFTASDFPSQEGTSHTEATHTFSEYFLLCLGLLLRAPYGKRLCSPRAHMSIQPRP